MRRSMAPGVLCRSATSASVMSPSPGRLRSPPPPPSHVSNRYAEYTGVGVVSGVSTRLLMEPPAWLPLGAEPHVEWKEVRMTAALSLPAVIRPMIVSLLVLLVVAGCSKDALTLAPSMTAQRVEKPEVGCVDQDVDDESDGSATSGSVTEGGVALARTEVFEFGDYALFVPACVDAPRALLVALGGPDTRAFVTDKAFGAPLPDVEAALHELGREFRALATRQGLAVMGTSRRSLPN